MVQAGETLAHAVERPSELAELVAARVDDRLVELAGRDPVGGPLEPADAPCEHVRAREPDEQCSAERQQARDQDALLDVVDRPEGVVETGAEQKERPGLDHGDGDLAVETSVPLDRTALEPKRPARALD